jgi:hypothetical protein
MTPLEEAMSRPTKAFTSCRERQILAIVFIVAAFFFVAVMGTISKLASTVPTAMLAGTDGFSFSQNLNSESSESSMVLPFTSITRARSSSVRSGTQNRT